MMDTEEIRKTYNNKELAEEGGIVAFLALKKLQKLLTGPEPDPDELRAYAHVAQAGINCTDEDDSI